MCQVEWHGELTKDWYDTVASTDNLPCDSIDANDEDPLSKPSQEAKDPEGPWIIRFHKESTRVD